MATTRRGYPHEPEVFDAEVISETEYLSAALRLYFHDEDDELTQDELDALDEAELLIALRNGGVRYDS